ncbi:MAG TPA: GNAT family N-acetyltransferase [Burkholderiaceae bacterium]
MPHPLDAISWNSLSGLHAQYAVGSDTARRYAKGYSPIIGFADPAQPDFDGLSPHCDHGEHFYCENWDGIAPAGWKIDEDATKFKMIWQHAMPVEDRAPEIVSLTPEHTPQVQELIKVASPGPFGHRTLELGQFQGWFEGTQLVAMAGERLRAGRYHEISSVCTHPEFQGKGLARRLTNTMIRQQMMRGELPFLQVMRGNAGARKLYEGMGFTVYCETVVRIISLA